MRVLSVIFLLLSIDLFRTSYYNCINNVAASSRSDRTLSSNGNIPIVSENKEDDYDDSASEFELNEDEPFEDQIGYKDSADFTVFGKDRELLHAAIDLKWLYCVLTNKNTWLSLIFGAVERIRLLNGGYQDQVKYRTKAIELLLNIRDLKPNSQLRYCMQHSNS